MKMKNNIMTLKNRVGGDVLRKVKSFIVITVVISLAWFWIGYSQRSPHQPISVKDIETIEFWSQHNSDSVEPYQREIAIEEIEKLVTWFNSATDIRENEDFAGITPICGIKINLKDGNEIAILSSGQDFEVQRYIFPMKKVSYWAKQPNIKKILTELGTELKEEIVSSSFSESEAIVYALQAHKKEVEELEFPSKEGEVKTVEINVGGKSPGLIIPVELTTNVEKIDDETYNITFTKVWKDKGAGKDVVSYWTYKVAPKEIDLIESQNNDGQFLLIK